MEVRSRFAILTVPFPIRWAENDWFYKCIDNTFVRWISEQVELHYTTQLGTGKQFFKVSLYVCVSLSTSSYRASKRLHWFSSSSSHIRGFWYKKIHVPYFLIIIYCRLKFVCFAIFLTILIIKVITNYLNVYWAFCNSHTYMFGFICFSTHLLNYIVMLLTFNLTLLTARQQNFQTIKWLYVMCIISTV